MTDTREAQLPPAAVGAGSGHLLLRNIGYLAGSQLTTWAATLAYTIVVTRAIGPRGNGELNAAAAIVGVFSLLVGVGSTTFVVREVAADRSRAPRIVATTLAVQLCTLPVVGALLTGYLVLEHFSREMTVVFILYAISLIPATFAGTLQAALQGIQRMAALAVSGVATGVAYNVVIIALVVLGDRNVVLIVAVLLALQFAAVGLTAGMYLRQLPLAWRTDLAAMVQVVRGSVPFLAATVAYTLYVSADTLVLTTLSSATEVGWYGAVNRLFGTLLVVSTILSTAWLPRLSAHARNDPEALRREARLVVRLGFVSAVPMAIGGSLLAGRIVVLIWGGAYAGAGASMAVLMLSLPATSLCTVVYQVLVARGRAALWATVMAVALALNVIANIVLITWFRSHTWNTALAASICLSFTEGAMAVVAIWMTRHDLGLGLLWFGIRATLAGLLMGVVVFLVSGFPLPLVIVIGALTFAVLAIAFRLIRKDEVQAVGGVLRRAARR